MQNTIIVIGNNPKLSEIVQKLLFEYGYSWYRDQAVQNTQEEALNIESLKQIMFATERFYRNNIPYSSFRFIDAATEMGELIKLLEGNRVITIKLNESYIAEISPDKKTVKVGCTTFDAERVKEVAKNL